MSNTVIKVEDLGKKYVISHEVDKATNFREVLSNTTSVVYNKLIHPFKKNIDDRTQEAFWALKDISFEVNQGDRLGVIGRNGAGKSTLLKVLSRITEPSKGRISIKGRIASLLEVGTGFHPELTGRENIYLNGAIMGMGRAEIYKKFDEIVAFAEVDKFLDTPVKRYSSGMYVRLAFAVAAHLDPEILIVDEVLAVGDAQFQKKCLGKMGDVSAKEGRTVLFVSHNMQAIQTLCDRVLLFDRGALVRDGETSCVINEYLDRSIVSKPFKRWPLENAPGNEKAKLISVSVKKKFQQVDENALFNVSDDIEMEFEFYNLMAGEHNLDVTIHLQDEMGVLAFVSGSGRDMSKKFEKGFIKAKCVIPGNLLNMGTFTISRLLLVKDRGFVVYEYPDALTFEVTMGDCGQAGWMGKKEGVVRPKLEWHLEYKTTE